LRAALEYVDRNATADTDYLVRVEQNEENLPKFTFSFLKQEDVTVRLRGYGGERTLKHGGGTTESLNNATGMANWKDLRSQDGFFNVGTSDSENFSQKKTFILENNITVEGGGEGVTAQNYKYYSLFTVNRNATLVMKKGSKLTKHNSAWGGTIVLSVIWLYNWDGTGPETQGQVRLEGGCSITDCTFPSTTTGLISTTYGTTKLIPGTVYKAASNLIDLSGNSNTLVVLGSITNSVDLNTTVEISAP
jgi:hypothetical protein